MWPCVAKASERSAPLFTWSRISVRTARKLGSFIRSSIRSRVCRRGRPARSSAASSWLKTRNSSFLTRFRRTRPRAALESPTLRGTPRRRTSKMWTPRLSSSLRRAISSAAVCISSSTRPSAVPIRQTNCTASSSPGALSWATVLERQHHHQGFAAPLAFRQPEAHGLIEPEVQVGVKQFLRLAPGEAAADLEVGQPDPPVGKHRPQPEGDLVPLADLVGHRLPLDRLEQRLGLQVVVVVEEDLAQLAGEVLGEVRVVHWRRHGAPA